MTFRKPQPKFAPAMHGYARARKDFEYLETIVELNDQVSLMDELENFMRCPTKAFAATLYESGITLWFGEHGADGHGRRVTAIAERWGEL
jgi:hypothetical protein